MEHFDTSEADKKSWAIYDQWRAEATQSVDAFSKKLEEWEAFVLANDRDVSNWARQNAMKEAGEVLDWNNHDADSTCKKAYEEVRRRIMKELGLRQDERLGIIPKRKASKE